MELRDVLKMVRSEIGINQSELANALHVSFSSVSRWETGKTYPNRSVLAVLSEYACAHSVSEECRKMLAEAIAGAKKSKIATSRDSLFAVEHASLSQLIDEASFPIYVCDMETDELLYVNNRTDVFFGSEPGQFVGKKCYECLMQRTSPCPYCHKDELLPNRFTTFQAFDPRDNAHHLVQGKLIQWNGRKAHVRYIINDGSALEATTQSGREAAYAEQLHLRRELAGDAIAVAHYNLTRNTVADIAGSSEKYAEYLSKHDLDDILRHITDEAFSNEDRKKLECICDRRAMIQQFFAGDTHITFRHYISGVDGVFEGVFDIMQNPVTFDIEAFAQLHNVTNAAMTAEVAKRLFDIDYETIIMIDADTGTAQLYADSYIHGATAEQKLAVGNTANSEAYLRKYCTDEDVDRVIRETALSYVKKQLKTKEYYYVTYSLRIEEKNVYKRAVYSYLDSKRSIILCAIQELTYLYETETAKRHQLGDALRILQEQSGMNIARYDLKTRMFYSNCDMTTRLGYGAVIKNVPDTFINGGHVAPESVNEFRSFYENLRRGDVSMLTASLEVEGGCFHRIHANARIIRDSCGEPEQAIIFFRDVDELREQATVYKRWRRSIEQRDPGSYTLFRCNLSRDASFDKEEGSLIQVQFKPEHTSFNERTKEYAKHFVYIDDVEAYLKLLNSKNLLASYYRGIRKAELTYRERVADGEYRWLHLSIEMTQHPDSSDVEVFMMYEPLGGEYKEKTNVNSLGGSAFANTGILIVKHDWKSKYFIYDPNMSKYVLGNYDNRSLWDIFVEDGVADAQDVKVMREIISELAESSASTSASLELQLKTREKRNRWFNVYALKQFDENKNELNIIITFLDINDDVLANKKLRFQSEHDSLTELYNRTSFLKLVTEYVSGKPANTFLLLCSDINDFEFFNSRYGREEGDRLLQYAAERLRAYAASKNGIAGRLSNDVFAILLPNTPGVLERAERIIRDYFDEYPLNVKITGRAGVYIISDPNMKADTILDMAAIAKESIKGRFDTWLAVFDEGMNAQRIREKYITDRMENALASGQFDVYIQPQFHHCTGQIVGAEALVRWNDPERGVVSPAEFIPVFEKTGFITKMDEYVWDKTARYISAWMEKGNIPVPISVNVSREDTDDPEFCQKLVTITEKYNIPTGIFRLEITESLFAENPKRLASVVDELHKAGFLVEMDDFGSGYSSLNILKDVSVDILKLDMRFFSGGDNLGRGGMIINAVLRMSRWLDIPVIAEGVELKEQADFLLSIGCPTIQGYLYERPLPVEDFEKLLFVGGKKQVISQNIIDSKIDVRSFWNPTSADSQVFNNCIGPAAVFEYHDGEYEIVRMNSRFIDAMQLGMEDAKLPARDIANICENDRARFRKAVLDVIYSCRDTKVDVMRNASDGTQKPLHVTMRIIAKSADRALIFGVLDA